MDTSRLEREGGIVLAVIGDDEHVNGTVTPGDSSTRARAVQQIDRDVPPRRGFTLVELLVVVVVIATIVGLLLPALAGVRATARDAVCKSNLNQIRLAMREYEVRTRHWSRTWDDIEVGESIQSCPAVRERAYPTYVFWMADGDSPRTFDQQVEAVADPIMVRDAYAPHFGRSNVAYLHAGVRSIGP